VKKKQTVRTQFRQGDVLILRVDEIPASATKVERVNGRLILAEGEATGHAHAIAEEEVSMFTVDASIAYLDVEMDAFVRHEEHGAIHLPPGKYEVRRQREYTPEAIRNVAD
jgi:hypothetical protein